MDINHRPGKRNETHQKCPYCESIFLMTHNRWVDIYTYNYAKITCRNCKSKFLVVSQMIVKDGKEYRDAIGIKPEDLNSYIHTKPEELEDILDKSIREFEFGRRAINILEDNHILFVRDLNGIDFFDLYRMPYTGPVFMSNVLKTCKAHNIVITCRNSKIDKVPKKYREYVKPVSYWEDH